MAQLSPDESDVTRDSLTEPLRCLEDPAIPLLSGFAFSAGTGLPGIWGYTAI